MRRTGGSFGRPRPSKRGRLSGTLPPDQRKVIELAYFGGFSHNEITKLLGLPLGTIKGRMRLGLKKMADKLAGNRPAS